MHHKIGVFGSNITEREKAVELAQDLGTELAQSKSIVIRGTQSQNLENYDILLAQ